MKEQGDAIPSWAC